MDSGLVTSEQAPHRRATVAILNTAVHAAPMMGPSVTCRQCRVQILLDDMETHECDPKDLKTATNSPRAAALLEAAAKASSFLDTFLDTSAETKGASAQKSGEASPVVVTDPKETKSAPRGVEVVASVTPAEIATNAVVVEDASSSYRYESLAQSHSLVSQSSSSSDVIASNPRTSPQHSLSRLGRSLSVSSSPPPTPNAVKTPISPASQAARPRGRSNSESLLVPFQSRVRGVRLNKDKVAVYSIVSNIPNQIADPQVATTPTALVVPREVIVERRYREFYAFALTMYSMFPNQDLWQRLPPKTLCLPTSRNQSGGFLLRRKNGLDDFVRRALELIDLSSDAQGTIGQWYLVRKFLNLPPTITGASRQTKDRNLVAAMNELTKHARQATGWTTVRRVDEHDATYEKLSDGFHMVKRVKTCPFPARAIFDRITKRAGAGTEPVAALDTAAHEEDAGTPVGKEPLSTEQVGIFYDPLVETVEVLRRENRQTWTERVVFKGGWTRRSLEMISLKSWKVDDTGSIVIVMIPAEDKITQQTAPSVELSSGTQKHPRVDCILGGWIISPIPGEDTCSVTWLMQANFGECDPRNEFTGSQGFSTAFTARSCLLSWAEEISHLLTSLETTYDPVYYRNLGPLLSGGDFNKLKLERRDTVSGNAVQDPRVYILAHELEPSMCLLIHKSTNTNALIFRTNSRRTVDKRQELDLDVNSPLKAEWIMFEKPGNPRQDLSVIERTTTYPFSVRCIGQNVFHFTLELLRRDCVLRCDPVHGYALFTTLNGKPNMLLKRVYLVFSSKTNSRLSFSSKLEEIHLFGRNEMEIIGA